MKFISLCSGIEAASVAFAPLGWKAIAFSEIDNSPSILLAYHYPDVPNLGDMTKFREWPEEIFVEADAIVGGPPCQAFSIAGARKGLDDARGNLTLIYVELINHADKIRQKHGRPPVVALYENVPGLLSDRTNAFGCLLGALAGEDDQVVAPGKRWSDAGCVFGPARAIAWRILDAQFFALAQRRRRVFVVASARNGFDPAAVLFEFEGVRRDSAPRRGAGQETAAGTLRRTDGGSDVDHARAGHILAFGGNNQSGPIDVATARNACASASGRMDFETETFLVQPASAFNARQDPDSWLERTGPLDTDGSTQAVCVTGDITHTLKAEGFNASEDGTGRGQPIVAVDTFYNKGFNSGDHNASTQEAYAGTLLRILCQEIGEEAFAEWRLGILDSLQPAQVLRADVHGAGIRREADEAGCGLDDRALPRQEGSSARGMPEMREAGRQRCAPQGRGLSEQLTRELDSALSKLPHEGAQPAWLLQGMRGSGEGARVLQSPLPAIQGGPFAVRRLTPVECERLMGFPDGYTAIPLPERRQGAAGTRVMADGPRYKALGNSWAVPVVRWIGRRLDAHLRDLDAKLTR